MAGTASAQIAGERQQPPQTPDIGAPSTMTPASAAPTGSGSTTQRSGNIIDPWQPAAAPRGVRVDANTVLFPSVTLGAFYDDNVFALSNNRRGSWGFIERPELALRSAGANYLTEAAAYLEAKQYERYSSEDHINGGAAVATTYQPDPDTQLVGKLRYTHGNEERGVGESNVLGLTTFQKPIAFDVLEAAAAVNKRYNRWYTSVGIAGTFQNYEDPTILGVPVSQDYRNGQIGVLSGRVGYVVAPLTSVFIETAGNQRNFQVDNFDSDGYRVVGGLLLEPGPGARVRGEVFAGYMFQNYVGPTFETVSTFTYGVSLAWAIAPRWTAVVEGRRVALESALSPTGLLNDGVSLVESTIGGRIDFAVMPNLIVGVGASYVEDDFQGVDRKDRTVSPLASIKYLAAPWLTLGFDYRNLDFGSTGFLVPSYVRNVYLFTLNARL